MFRSIKNFLTDKRGAFAMQFALMAIPLTVCTGLAIDGGRAFLARFELSSALDAAALAVGSTLQEGADLDAIAEKFVDRNFRTEHDEPISLELVPGEDTLILRGSVTINTYFMPLIGQPYVTVAAESEVKRGGSNVEVAMALDITGSMTTTRMAGLRAAAGILVEEVVNPIQTPYTSKVAIVPWSQAVYVDDEHVAANVHLDLRGSSLTGTKSVSAANWRNSSTTTKTVSEAGWRTLVGPRTIANAASNGTGGIDWRKGVSRSVTGFTKVSANTRIQVTTSANHGYVNGEFVRLTGITSGSYTALNNTIFMVADKTNTTFNLKNVTGLLYIVPPVGSTSSTATSQRCWDTVCSVAVTTTADFTGLAAGDRVNITGTSGFPSSQTPNYINNSNTTTWPVAAVINLRTFTIAGWTGPSFGTSMNSGGGTVSECLTSDCRYRVTTTAAHSFLSTDNVFLWNFVEEADGLTSANNAVNTSRSVDSPSGSVFYLPGVGKTYNDWDSGGSGAECALSTCNTRITVASHGLTAGDYIELKSVGGMTGLNNPTSAVSSPVELLSKVSWRVSDVSGNVLTLEGTSPAHSNMSGTYSSGGTSQCLDYGCAKYGFMVAGGDAADPSDFRVYTPSPCLAERYGDDAATDADPATAPLGINYTSNGDCTRTNYVTPLTSNKTRLNQSITDLATGGSTAGQMGIAWAWYMLSPNFASIWDKEAENVPKSYTSPELAKIAILMTDGEFNFATCEGVPSSTWGSGTRNSCDPAQDPFTQAQAICTAMKTQDITIYTVGLELDTSLSGDEFLTACATTPAHAFLADNNAELENAFKDIAISISKLRISK